MNYLERVFLNMLNEVDLEWVNFLERIERYAPQNKRILAYRLQYFQAVNDINKINEYEKKVRK